MKRVVVIGALGLPTYRNAERAAIDKAQMWLDRVGLIDRADDPAGELPYGARRAAVPFERIAEAVAGRTGAAECR